MFQTGSTLSFYKTETVFTNWFYPQNSELVHAVGMALTGRDFFSVLLNMGWLALALLAAWCIGRPYARPHLTLIAASILLATHTLVVREPGTAKNDIVAIALILSAVAILINRGADPSDTRGRLGPGWAMAAAGLAVGLAAGTKVTALAPAAMITFAVLFSAHRRDEAALGWRSGSVPDSPAAGSGTCATCLPPAIRSHRSRASDRSTCPDRSVSRRAGRTSASSTTSPTRRSGASTSFRVWSRASVSSGHCCWPSPSSVWCLLIWRGPGRLTRAHGFAALVAIVAYLVTPLSAAGPEGSPDAFSINLRFLVPALAMALVLIPLLPWFKRPRPQLALGLLLLFLFFATGRGDAIWSESGRYFGVAFALVFVVLPALAWHYREPLAQLGPGKSLITWVAAVFVTAGLLLSWPLATGYFDSRYVEFEPENGLAEPYRWASGIEDAEIGLAGTTAGFRQFGFFGDDLSNRLTYIGREAPNEGFDVIRTCPEFKQAVNEAELDYLVTSPFLDFIGDREPSTHRSATRWPATGRSRRTLPGRSKSGRSPGSSIPSPAIPSGPGPETTPGLVE